MAPPRPVQQQRALAVLPLLLLLASSPRGAAARRTLATIPYTLQAPAANAGVDLLSPSGAKSMRAERGGTMLIDFSVLSPGSALGRALGSCPIADVDADGGARALCTIHYEWDGGATAMVAHGNLQLRGANALSGRLAIVGGIGRYQGAHGEDLGFVFDGKAGRGSGNIKLYCLDGVC